MPRALGPFKIKEKIGENAYKVDLPEEYYVSDTFNIGDLLPYEGKLELRPILSEEGGVEPNVHGSSSKLLQDQREAKTS